MRQLHLAHCLSFPVNAVPELSRPLSDMLACVQVSQQAREAAAARSGQTEQEVPANLLQYLAWLRAHSPNQAAEGPPLLASQMPTVSDAAAACKVSGLYSLQRSRGPDSRGPRAIENLRGEGESHGIKLCDSTGGPPDCCPVMANLDFSPPAYASFDQ